MTLDINTLSNATIFDRSGDKIGTVGSVYVSDDSGRPSFVTVKTGLFGTKETFVPVDQATETAEGLQVPFEKAFVKDAPNVDADGHISEAEEDEIHRYYAGHRTDTSRDGAAGLAADRDRHADLNRGVDHGDDARREDLADDGSMVRREEELHVGTERVETGRVRLRKHVVTEQKTVTVPVEREEVELVREPVADGHSSNGRIGEDEQVVTLSEERPVVAKEVVDKERVGLQTNTVRDEEQVSAEVRREEVDIDRDGTELRDERRDNNL